MRAVVVAIGVALLSVPALAGQFPGQGAETDRSRAIIDRERAERDGTLPDNDYPEILVPGKDDRIQLDRWTFSAATQGIDPLTQIVRMRTGGTGTGFLLDECRVMTNLHVVTDKMTVAERELVGEEVEYESLPIPWLDNARAVSKVLILGHGFGPWGLPNRKINSDYAHQDWAIGYDLGCASRTYDLGIVHLGEPIRSLDELRGLKTFAAGFTAFKMPGLSDNEFPLYIDSNCRVLKPASLAKPTSWYETNCSSAPGASGQPLLSGLLADPRNPNMFQSERGRPRLVALAMTNAGGGFNMDVPNFRTQSFDILFDEAMMRAIGPFLRGPVDVARLRRTPPSADAKPIIYLRARYTEGARRRLVEGAVQIEFSVRADGTVERASLVSSIDPGGLDALALAAAQKWRFEPVTSNGAPIAHTVRWSMAFRLPPQ